MRRLIWPIREFVFTWRDRMAVMVLCAQAVANPGSSVEVYRRRASNRTRQWLYAEVVRAVRWYEKYTGADLRISSYVDNGALVVQVQA